MCKISIFLLIAIALLLPPSALANTIYFMHDAESDPIVGGDPTKTWDEAQSKVTRSQTVAKNGNFSLRHEIVADVDIQTGKVIKFVSLMPSGGLVSAYYSNWVYIDQGFEDTNPDIWKNIFQFKTQGGNQGKGVKIVVTPYIINGVFQLRLAIGDCEVPSPSTVWPEYDTSTFFWGGGCKFARISDPIPFPRKQWVHMEVFLKAADPHRLGNQDLMQPGQIIVWQDGQEVFDVSHPDLNTLTVFDDNKEFRSQLWTNNKWLYWGIGMYASELSKPPLQVIYTDDAMVTDYPVHQSTSADTLPPSPPSGLRVMNP